MASVNEHTTEELLAETGVVKAMKLVVQRMRLPEIRSMSGVLTQHSVPLDVGMIGGREVSRLMTEATHIASFIEVDLARVQSEVGVAKHDLGSLMAKLLLTTTGGTVKEKEAKVTEGSEHVRFFQMRLLYLQTIEKLLKPRLAAAEREYALLSRELGRREKLADMEMSAMQRGRDPL